MYVDGFVLPLREQRLPEYTAMAATFAAKAREQGALGTVEALGDGLEHGTLTDFYRSVQAEGDENVVFSFILWPDKATRDAGWEKLMVDPDLKPAPDAMPFDGRRMFWGGFRPFVNTFDPG